jgi:hypothetical protein
MMKKYFVLLLLICSSSIASPLIAETFSYTSISLGYGRFSDKIDGVPESIEGDGYTIDISYDIRPHIALIAGYSISIAKVHTDGKDFNADIDATLLGMVIHFPINETADFVLGIGFINGKADVSINGGEERKVDANGGLLTVGFRGTPYENVELRVDIRKNSIEEESSISLDFSTGYYVLDSVLVDIGYRLDTKDGSSLINLGVTKYF